MIDTTLADLSLRITDGKHGDCRDCANSGFYFISCKDVNDGQIIYENARQIYEEDFFDAHKRTRLEPDDILVTNSGTIGRMAFIEDVPATYRTTFQKSVAIVKPDKERVLPQYLYYQLQNCVDGFVHQSNGSAQKNLLLSTMRAFTMRIHENMQEQLRIASILAAYDNLIKNNRKQIKLLEEAAQRLYKEWFVDLRFPGHESTPIVDGIPEGWFTAAVTDLLEIRYGKDHKALGDGEIPAYGSGGIMRRVNKVLYSGESVLIPRKGSLNNILLVSGDFWTIDTMFYSIPKRPNIAKYVYLYLIGIDMYAMNIGAAVPSMTVKILDGMRLLCPNDSILELFENTVKPYYDMIELLKKKQSMLSETRDRLLPKLMSGEIEV